MHTQQPWLRTHRVSSGASLLLAGNSGGDAFQLQDSALAVGADAVIHFGDFGFETTESRTQLLQRDLTKAHDGYIHALRSGAKKLSVPMYLVLSHEQRLKPSILLSQILDGSTPIENLKVLSDVSQTIFIPSKNYAFQLLDLSTVSSEAMRSALSWDTSSITYDKAPEESMANDAINALLKMSNCSPSTPDKKCIKMLINHSGWQPVTAALAHLTKADILSTVPCSDTQSTFTRSLLRCIYFRLHTVQGASDMHFRLYEAFKVSLENLESFVDYAPAFSVKIPDFSAGHVLVNLSCAALSMAMIQSRQQQRMLDQSSSFEDLIHTDGVEWNQDAFPNSADANDRLSTPTMHSRGNSASWCHDGDVLAQQHSLASIYDLESSLHFDTLSDVTETSEMEGVAVCTVLVGNFPDETTETELRTRFRGVNVLKCKIVNNKKADRRPFAFMEVKECDRDLILKMNGERFHGLKLKVEYDPSRLEKLGQKRNESGQSESSSHLSDTPIHSLKKSSSLGSLEFCNLAINAAQVSTRVGQNGLTRARSQLMTSSQLAQQYDAWNNGSSASDSLNVGQSLDTCRAWGAKPASIKIPTWTNEKQKWHASPVDEDPSSIKSSSWDSPPRKLSPFSTGAYWEKPPVAPAASLEGGTSKSTGTSTTPKWGSLSEASSSKTSSPNLQLNQGTVEAKENHPWNPTPAFDSMHFQGFDADLADANHVACGVADAALRETHSFDKPKSLNAGLASKTLPNSFARGQNMSYASVEGWNSLQPVPHPPAPRSRAGSFSVSEPPKPVGASGFYPSGGIPNAGAANATNPKSLAQTRAMESVMNFNQQIMSSALSNGPQFAHNLTQPQRQTGFSKHVSSRVAFGSASAAPAYGSCNTLGHGGYSRNTSAAAFVSNQSVSHGRVYPQQTYASAQARPGWQETPLNSFW
ncbi:hypothetical protein HDU81_004445 [Chytriomyces hyalinus]|nr:hypothetical protein HDU81_004445 [Chytriomyces hyalinus]